MVNDLTAPRAGLPTPYLPQQIGDWIKRIGGTVEHPGQPRRYHIENLPEEIRAEARSLRSTLNSALNPEAPFADRPAYDARVGIVTALILGLANAGTTAESAEARFDLFEVALHDVPAWAVAAGAARWVRREVPVEIDKNPNFAFPPGPGTLRALALLEMQPYQSSIENLRRLIESVTHERAMDPKPIREQRTIGETAPLVPKLRRM